jgi:bifunctional non-homologous end joining protein LigD
MRSGAWMKMRVDRGQEFVIGGYTLGTKTFDAIVFGYYEGKKLMYVTRTRNGFTPATRRSFQEVRRAGDPGLPVCESAGGKRWQVGTGAHEGKDGGMPLAQADAGLPDRVSRMDQRQSPPALAIRRSSQR